jgi:hypothetical protein
VEQLPSKEGSAYPFDLCKQKGGRRSIIKRKNLKQRSAVLSDIHSLAQDGKICKGFFKKISLFIAKTIKSRPNGAYILAQRANERPSKGKDR